MNALNAMNAIHAAYRFRSDGRRFFPSHSRRKLSRKLADASERFVVEHAYCPNGCSIIDPQHVIGGAPGLLIRYRRPGAEGLFVLSAFEGELDKIILSGELVAGVKDDLYCPHCDAMFAKLLNCNCSSDADMVVVGLTPSLDFHNAITFCNVTGCHNGSFISSGAAIRRAHIHGQL